MLSNYTAYITAPIFGKQYLITKSNMTHGHLEISVYDGVINLNVNAHSYFSTNYLAVILWKICKGISGMWGPQSDHLILPPCSFGRPDDDVAKPYHHKQC